MTLAPDTKWKKFHTYIFVANFSTRQARWFQNLKLIRYLLHQLCHSHLLCLSFNTCFKWLSYLFYFHAFSTGDNMFVKRYKD